MLERSLRRYCRSVAQNIPIPRPFSIQVLCEELAIKNGRRIHLHPYPPEMAGEDMPCGMWVATAAADHIFFEKKTSQYHQGHIILHEVGHMLCRHTMTDAAGYLLGTRADQEGSDLVLDADQVMGALLRTSYSDRQEREAELVASMILERAMAWDSKNATAGERYFGEVLGFE